MQDEIHDEVDVHTDAAATNVLTVLIIDDHRMFAESMSRLLSDEDDIDVVGIATTGAEGLQLADELLPRVVLVDFQLPEQDGVVIAGQPKQRHPTMMVIMLTGLANDRVLLANDRVLLAAIDAGCSGFVTKDRPASGVVEAVRSAAASEAVISPVLLARLLPKLGRTGPRPVGARSVPTSPIASARSSGCSLAARPTRRSPPSCSSASTRCATTSSRC